MSNLLSICRLCNKEFMFEYKNGPKNRRYCPECISNPPLCLCGCGNRVTRPTCRYIYEHQRIGRHHTEETKYKIRLAKIDIPRDKETRKKISVGNKGKNRTEETKRKLSIARNKHGQLPHTEETKRKIKISHLTKEVQMKTQRTKELHGGYKGSKSPGWKGGIARLPYPFEFNWELKQGVKQRDKYICQLCGIEEHRFRGLLNIHHIDYNKSNSSITNLMSLCPPCHSKTNKNRPLWATYLVNLLDQRRTRKVLLETVVGT